MSSLAAPSAVVRPVGPRDEPLVRVAPLEIGPLVVDPPVLQAPMAGFTNYAFRQIVREFGGAGLQATEMVHAKGFLWLEEQQDELPDRLWGVAEEPRPLAVQIWDNDPETLAAVGAKLAHEFARERGRYQLRLPRAASHRKSAQRLVLAAIAGSRGGNRRARGASVLAGAGDGQDSPGLHARFDQRDRSRQGGRSGRRRGTDGARPHGGKTSSPVRPTGSGSRRSSRTCGGFP